MTSRNDAARAAMRMHRERYRAASGAIVDAFRSLAAELSRAPDSADVIESVRREAHRIRGTAGTYGFLEASRIAEVLERRSAEWSRDAAADAGRRSDVVNEAAEALATAFAEPRDPGAAGANPG